MKSVDKKSIEIKVQFEYLNDNDTLVLSKEYKVKISLDEKASFETNKKKILSQSNFRTQKERNNFHMFNKSKKRFLTKNSDFEPYIKTKSPIILINSYEYADKVVKKLNEDLDSFYDKNDNVSVNEIKNAELINDLACLENNLEVDIFADEFIFKNGMDILLKITKENCGDKRLYSIKGINKLLEFEAAIDFFIKNENNLNKLFIAFIGNNELSSEYTFFDVIIKLISANQEIITSLINQCDTYFFRKIIKFLDEDNKDNDLKNYILFFINTILNFIDNKKQYELIKEITNEGIFDNLFKIKLNEEETLFEQIDLFEFTVKNLLEKKEDNNNYEDINEKFGNYINKMKFIKIQNLIVKINSKDEEIKKEAIEELNKIVTDNNNNLDIIYEAYIRNEKSETINLFYLYFLQLFESNENNINNFIIAAKKYSESNKSKPLEELIKILNYPKPSSLQLKIDTFSFINKTLQISANFTDSENYLGLLYMLTEAGIFEYLLNEEKEETLNKEKMKFKEIIDNNLSKLEKNNEKCKAIKIKLEKINEKKILNDINDLFLQLHNTSATNHLIIAKKLIDMLNISDNNFKMFFKIFAENDVKNLNFSFFEILEQYCVGGDELCMKFIQASNEYEKQFKINCFSKIINYLDEYQNELVQIKALNLVNILLSIQDKKISFEILNKFNKDGIFENLVNLIKIKEKAHEVKIQLGVFITIVKELLQKNKKGENFDTIKKKFKKLEDTKNKFDKSIDDFITLDGK